MKTDALVLKIGGSLLDSAKSYAKAAENIAETLESRGKNMVVVVSAARGITDLLIQASRGAREAYVAVARVYTEICEELCSTPGVRRLREELSELEKIADLGDPDSPALADLMLSYGERLSKMVMREALETQGLRVFEVDARDVIVTDARHGDASIDYELTSPRVEKMYRAAVEARAVPILEGFVGATPQGRVTTLGRGGSDYTATAIASILGAEAELVTEVDGIMSADPRLIPSARVVNSLSYLEAAEASLHGVKRMNPKALEPLMKVRPIDLRIRSWRSRGTLVSSKPHRFGFKIATISSTSQQTIALIGELESRVEGALRALNVLLKAGIEVDGIELPLGRPVLKMQILRGDAIETLRRLHEELIET
ncbi:MAG: aspartate kinase [Acidilobaceae archaeon]